MNENDLRGKKMEKFTALVPMKAHSERVNNKNIRDMCGKPLFYYIIQTLQKCHNIDKIVVNTDSDIIKEKIRNDFPDVIILDRPEELRGDFVPMNSIIEHDLNKIEGDYFFQTHSTNPLLRPETIDKSIELLLSMSEYDSLFSVNKMQKRYFDSKCRPINHDLSVMQRSQDLDPIYEENSCIFLFTRKSFGFEKNRIGKNPYMFEIDREEAMDIDEEFDFKLVECIIQNSKDE